MNASTFELNLLSMKRGLVLTGLPKLLRDRGLADNTIVAFFCDNGIPYS